MTKLSKIIWRRIDDLALFTQRHFVGSEPMEDGSKDGQGNINSTQHLPETVCKKYEYQSSEEKESQRENIDKVPIKQGILRVLHIIAHYGSPPCSWDLEKRNRAYHKGVVHDAKREENRRER